jgi:hypothetical protein
LQLYEFLMFSSRLPFVSGLLALMLLSSCHRKAVPTTTAAGPGTSTPIAQPQGMEPSLPTLKPVNTTFEFLNAKGKAALELKGDKKNVNLSVRMQRDKAIWMSAGLAGFEGARVLLTPDSVRVLNRLENTYFVGGYDYLSQLLNVPVSFADMQALLLGDYLPAPAGSKPTLEAEGADKQRVRYPRQNVSVERLLLATTGRVQQLKVSETGAKRSLTVDYGDFKPLEEAASLPFAHDLRVQAQQANGTTMAALSYSKVSVGNTPLEFPFDVPKGFKRTK